MADEPYDVFISYAKTSSGSNAEALQNKLAERGVKAFRFEGDLKRGEPFPEAIVEALLGSRVFVAFPDQAYFDSEPCRQEWEGALTRTADRTSRVSVDAEVPRPHIVLARPAARGAALRETEASLPKGLRTIWSVGAGDAEGLARLVDQALARSPRTLAARIGAPLARDLRRRLLDGMRLPRPQRFGKIRLFPARMPPSIGDAFVGRDDDLWRLHAVVRPTRTGPGSPVAIEAMGGVGKTKP